MKKEMSFNETKEKMVKACKNLSILVEVIEYVLIFFAICIAIWSIILMIQSRNFNITEDIVNSDSLLEFIQMISPIKFLSSIATLHFLAAMLIDTYKKETPFTPKNVKALLAINVIVDILWIFTDTFSLAFGFIASLTIAVIGWIFKYGCFLQKDSDETV